MGIAAESPAVPNCPSPVVAWDARLVPPLAHPVTEVPQSNAAYVGYVEQVMLPCTFTVIDSIVPPREAKIICPYGVLVFERDDAMCQFG